MRLRIKRVRIILTIMITTKRNLMMRHGLEKILRTGWKTVVTLLVEDMMI